MDSGYSWGSRFFQYCAWKQAENKGVGYEKLSFQYPLSLRVLAYRWKYPVLDCNYYKRAENNTGQTLKHLNDCLSYTNPSFKSYKRLVKRQQTLQLRVQLILR